MMQIVIKLILDSDIDGLSTEAIIHKDIFLKLIGRQRQLFIQQRTHRVCFEKTTSGSESYPISKKPHELI